MTSVGLSTACHADPAKRRMSLGAALDEGAIGIGVGINYTLSSDQREIEATFRVAAQRAVPVFVQPRGFGIGPIREVVDAAQAVGCSIHIGPIGSFANKDLPEALMLIDVILRT